MFLFLSVGGQLYNYKLSIWTVCLTGSFKNFKCSGYVQFSFIIKNFTMPIRTKTEYLFIFGNISFKNWWKTYFRSNKFRRFLLVINYLNEIQYLTSIYLIYQFSIYTLATTMMINYIRKRLNNSISIWKSGNKTSKSYSRTKSKYKKLLLNNFGRLSFFHISMQACFVTHSLNWTASNGSTPELYSPFQ